MIFVFLAMLNAGTSAWNFYEFAEKGEPINLGAGVLGLVTAILCSIWNKN